LNGTVRAVSDIGALIAQIRPTLLGLEIGLHIVERVHGTSHALPDELIELDRL
jgi:hypothetical protein